MTEAVVLPLREEEVGEASAVIARAFHEDPLTVHLYPDADTRGRLAPDMFEAIVRYDCLFGQVDRLPGFTALATWLKPGEATETPERLAAAGFNDLSDEIPLDRLDAFFSVVGPAHERAVPEPHWYLRLLGVDPAHQGEGLGSTLLRYGLDRADASGHSCFLETFAERNVPFYVGHGFELVIDEIEPATGIRIWGFHRAPRA
jgi:GNAT superfamily N-acetyltransferase